MLSGSKLLAYDMALDDPPNMRESVSETLDLWLRRAAPSVGVANVSVTMNGDSRASSVVTTMSTPFTWRQRTHKPTNTTLTQCMVPWWTAQKWHLKHATVSSRAVNAAVDAHIGHQWRNERIYEETVNHSTKQNWKDM